MGQLSDNLTQYSLEQKSLHQNHIDLVGIRRRILRLSTAPCDDPDPMEKHDEVLIALRQIIRAIDMHSKRLIKEAGLTSPQLLLLKGIDDWARSPCASWRITPT